VGTVKRRPSADVAGSVPPELLTFVAPVVGVSAAFRRWCDARQAWAAEHPWPGGEAARAAGQMAAAIRLPNEPWPVQDQL
jgi:hypothetical protein